MKNNNKIKILNFKNRIFLGLLFLGLLFLISGFFPNTAIAATYAEKAKELCQTTKNNLGSTKNWEKDIVNGSTIGSIDNETIYIYISNNETSSYVRDGQTFSIGDKKWIKVNS
ncbi:MAG: hypothetical protein PHW50_00210, partial [Patescibacteria group bacterium]|nr:hypothetical protein [Patescibacteria group bacterium]